MTPGPEWPADRVERRPLEALVPYAQNARTHSPAQVDAIAASIREWGWTMPLLVDGAGTLIAGHGRVMAAQKLGITEAPVMVATGWTEEQVRAYRIADNKLSLLAGWDDELLAAEFKALDGEFDLGLTGFTSDEIDRLMQGVFSGLTDPDQIPQIPETAITNLGDLWLLGDNRLLCGDSSDADDIARLMVSQRASLFATDPPYAVNYKGGSHPVTASNRGKKNRNKNWSAIYKEADDIDSSDDGEAFYRAFTRLALDLAVDERAAWYCWHASARQKMLEAVWQDLGIIHHQQIIWSKTRPVLTHSFYMWQHEPCMMGWLQGNKPNGKSSNLPDGFSKSTIWQVDSKDVSADHPTSKPTKLFIAPMLYHTTAGDICYEPFSGSGTQIIAAELTGRRCFAMEISPLFVDVAVQRWQDFTGKTAIRESDGCSFDESRLLRLPALASA